MFNFKVGNPTNVQKAALGWIGGGGGGLRHQEGLPWKMCILEAQNKEC